MVTRGSIVPPCSRNHRTNAGNFEMSGSLLFLVLSVAAAEAAARSNNSDDDESNNSTRAAMEEKT